MGLYNFKKQFVPFILSGEKTHTIRAERVHPDKPGNTLHLYTGLRTKTAKLLMRVKCVRVESIVITDTPLRRIVIDGRLLDLDEEESLARRDGFPDFETMMKFWDGRVPFKGNIVHWKPDIIKLSDGRKMIGGVVKPRRFAGGKNGAASGR